MTTPTSPTSRSSDIALRLRGRVAHARRSGFTLVELAVVLVIISILFFALRPGITGALREAQERTALRQLVSTLSYARTDAVGNSHLVRVNWDPAEGAFWAEAQTDPQQDRSIFEPLRVLGKSKVVVPQSLNVNEFTVAGEDASNQGSQIYFYPDGRTDGARLALGDDTGREIVIELSAATGKVSIGA